MAQQRAVCIEEIADLLRQAADTVESKNEKINAEIVVINHEIEKG
jgi:hypothetical protein